MSGTGCILVSSTRWIVEKNLQVRILNEFSATELLGTIFMRRNEESAWQALTENELAALPYVTIGGRLWSLLYTRRESTTERSYLATALRKIG
jgi:hypothetical protein